ncbi:class I glutamine amidotransferase-like protein [Clohesyomyces aquaticus]|uniref:Class I glutamine amidotransferase-like protein n=1 Tax=Clohesyomyces aquaticus TaxID=1231657 RepID=A0A1Y1YIM2_9PLEO|nr:class I glutamine amidotransferase-like protein [Clohesyomyces aquaticus]
MPSSLLLPLLPLLPLLLSLSPTLAIPSQPLITNTTTLPTNYAMLVYQSFTALDVFGPLDILNGLSMYYSNTTSMHISVISSTLEPVTTVPLPNARMNMTHGDFGEKMLPTHTFAEVLAANGSVATGEIEVLIVPGGGGARDDRFEEIEFVKAMYPKLKYILSVCTGATILARAGILDGHRATTNKRAWTWATSTGPKVDWVPTARWVQDGNLWTSSGVSAGMDLTYAWIGHVYGEAAADYIAMSSEYRRWYNASEDPFAEIWGAK